MQIFFLNVLDVSHIAFLILTYAENFEAVVTYQWTNY